MNGDVATLQRLGDQAPAAVPFICNKVIYVDFLVGDMHLYTIVSKFLVPFAHAHWNHLRDYSIGMVESDVNFNGIWARETPPFKYWKHDSDCKVQSGLKDLKWLYSVCLKTHTQRVHWDCVLCCCNIMFIKMFYVVAMTLLNFQHTGFHNAKSMWLKVFQENQRYTICSLDVFRT